jgi:hypothetical protein
MKQKKEKQGFFSKFFSFLKTSFNLSRVGTDFEHEIKFTFEEIVTNKK